MIFKPILTCPEAGDKFFIRVQDGGYNNSIEGKPKHENLTVLANCVGYVRGAFHKRAGDQSFKLLPSMDAERLFDYAVFAGFDTGQTPKLGSVICWRKGSAQSSSDGAGHVACVEEIASDGTITISESGYGSFYFNIRKLKPPYIYGSAYTLQGFIYLPDSIPTKVLRTGMTGSDVSWMQSKLAEKGYLRESEVDGDFGKITLGGLLAFQFEHDLSVDGVCGPATKRKLCE